MAMPTMDVMDVGRMGFAQLSSGGVFGFWQARAHTGFGLANEPGSVTWNEFMTRDYAGAKEFYEKVFGYTYTEMGDGTFDYAMVEVDGTAVGGLGGLPAEVPAQVPPHWRVYFAVEDCDAAAAKCAELGGTVMSEPKDMPYGRFADLIDPQGAMFSVIKMAGQPPE
jgi:predicted enzyme related to lactoylglutathione lyase